MLVCLTERYAMHDLQRGLDCACGELPGIFERRVTCRDIDDEWAPATTLHAGGAAWVVG